MSAEIYNKDVDARHSLGLQQIPDAEYERKGANVVPTNDGLEVNVSGHEDELQRQYGLLSLCGLALTIDNAWVAFGGSIILASYNGDFLLRLYLVCKY